MKRSRKIELTLLALAALALLWGLVGEPSRLVEREVSIRVAGMPSFSVALLSDIHAGCHFVDRARLRQVVATINGWQPDLVALLGDYVTESAVGTPIPIEVTAGLLGELRARSGVFAVLGNHDWWQGGASVQQALTGAGVQVLEGEASAVEVRGQRMWVLGVPDATTRSDRVEATWQRAPQDAPVLALTHSPDVFPGGPARVRLTLAGHTHGGQVRLPLLGAPMVPSRYGQRYLHGAVEEGGRHLYVTSGLGMSVLPVRWGVPPEVVLLRVNP